MKLKGTAVAIMALAMAAGSLAQAQDRRDDRGRNNNADRRGNDVRQQDRGRHDNQGDWRRGGRLPNEYRDRHYVVDDWRGHNLHRPPRGYHWVQRGNDYALAAIASGVIAELLTNHR